MKVNIDNTIDQKNLINALFEPNSTHVNIYVLELYYTYFKGKSNLNLDGEWISLKVAIYSVFFRTLAQYS